MLLEVLCPGHLNIPTFPQESMSSTEVRIGAWFSIFFACAALAAGIVQVIYNAVNLIDAASCADFLSQPAQTIVKVKRSTTNLNQSHPPYFVASIRCGRLSH